MSYIDHVVQNIMVIELKTNKIIKMNETEYVERSVLYKSKFDSIIMHSYL